MRSLLLCPAAALTLAAQNPAAIEHHLRYVVRLAAEPDSALEIADRMRAYHIPGLSLAVIDNWRVVYARGFGTTVFGGSKPVDTTTLFLAGSVSKPVFATGLLRLVEDGRISLDADVNTLLKSWHLPDSRFTATEKVTLRRILTHSAGLTVWGFPGYTLTDAVPTVPQILDGAPPANTPAVRNDTTPNAFWRYSGGGITIAQLVSTDVTGEPFPALMQRLVLRPSGMTRSTYENPLPVARRGEAATGHEEIDTPIVGGFHVYPEMAAAGLWTTPADLARWALALAHSYRGEPGGVLSPAMARQMVSKQMAVKPPFGNGFWGLGVTVDGDGDSVRFSHGGDDWGFLTTAVMWPQLGRGFVIMMNGKNGALFSEIQRAYAEEYGGLGSGPRLERKRVALDAKALARFTGKYARVAGRDTVRLEVGVAPGGYLAITHSLQRRTLLVAPTGDSTFVGMEGGGVWSYEGGTFFNGTGPNRLVYIRQ